MVSKYFKTQELVSPQIYAEYGEFALTAIDDRAIVLLDVMREYFGKLTINDWLWNDKLGNYKYSGLRTMKDEFYKPLSQHSFGRSFDIKCQEMPTAQLYQAIIDKKDYFIEKGLTGLERLEDTPAWVHITVGDYGHKGQLAIIPIKGEIKYL